MSTPPDYEQMAFEDDSIATEVKAAPKKKAAAKKKSAAKKKVTAKKKTAAKKQNAAKKQVAARKRASQNAPSVTAPKESRSEEPESQARPEESVPASNKQSRSEEPESQARPEESVPASNKQSRSEEPESQARPEESVPASNKQSRSEEPESQARPKESVPASKNPAQAREADRGSRKASKPDDAPEQRRSENKAGGPSDRNDERRSRRGRRPRGHKQRDRDRDQDGDDKTGERPPRKEIELGPASEETGFVELTPKGFGFLRHADRNFYQTNRDTFIPPDMVRDYGLRDGLILKGEARQGPRGPQLTAIHTINDKDPSAYQNLPVFEELTAINPNKRWILETDPKRHTTRIIDMITPVGRGQRGLIVAPPRTGKTTLLEHIAQALDANYPDTKVILLLVDERPEEVTELKRALPNAEIMASSNDNDTRTHMRVAELTIERAKRMVEAGEHVFILLDSITRLARAFNRANKGKGGLNKGGLSNRALEVPRRLFAAARNTREAGSLTILATALIETGTMMDEAIFQEFKGTGNLELVLDKTIAQNYIFPAVNIFKSGTRREELLLPPHQIEKIYVIRRGLSGHKPIEAIERLLSFVERFPNNAQMLLEIKASAAGD